MKTITRINGYVKEMQRVEAAVNQPLIFLGKVVLLTAQLLEGAKLHVSTRFRPFCLTFEVKKGVFVVRANYSQ